MKQIIGRQTKLGYIVELENENSMTTRLSLAKSFQVVVHSPEGFRWGDSSPGSSQLSAAILYEVTSDADMARQYYQRFRYDCVEKWRYTFKINEFQVKRWLRNKGEEKYTVDMASIIDAATAEFEKILYFYIRVKHVRVSTAEQEQEMTPLCELAILLSCDWIQEYRRYILELDPAECGTTSEGYKWKPMLEGIRDQLPLFMDLLCDQQPDHWLLEKSEEVKRDVMELLARHIYLHLPFF